MCRTADRRRTASKRPSSTAPDTVTTVARSLLHIRTPGARSRPLTSRGVPEATATVMQTPRPIGTTRAQCPRSATDEATSTAIMTMPRASTSGSGRDAAARATPATHARSARVGRWRSAAAVPPSSPAGSPATRPHTIKGPAAGTANRFAGTDARGTPPKTATSRGDTPACAAKVTAKGAGTRRAWSTGPMTAIPTQAPADSRNPTDPASMGSTSTRPVTARASTRSVDTGRPDVEARRVIPAMATARRTEGSQRVRIPNPKSRTAPAPKRDLSPSRRSSGDATTRTKATF